MFCISGIILNHRSLFSHVDISRSFLPSDYQYKKWNRGLLRGSLSIQDKERKSVLIYGTSGIWRTDSLGSFFEEFNEGFPEGADNQTVQAISQTKTGELFACTQFAFYRRQLGQSTQWQEIPLPNRGHERLADICLHADTLCLLTRSCVYLSSYPYTDFIRKDLKALSKKKSKVSLFRTVWLLHSGELFGLVGKLFVDALAIVLLILCITGLIYWFMPKYIKRFKKNKKHIIQAKKFMLSSLRWHDVIGRKTLYLTLFLVFTGWCLRPPLLIPLARTKVPPVPGTILDNPNPWNEKLRMIRYDEHAQKWLISTSSGFYEFGSFDQKPKRIKNCPPVSVMGIKAWDLEPKGSGRYLIGSFQGLYLWDKEKGVSIDYFTGKRASNKPSAPFGKKAISGYSKDFAKPLIIEYNEGTEHLAMPEFFSALPMSLWNIALEVHTGRIYTFLGMGTLLFISFSGLFCLWLLYTGAKLKIKRKN